MGESMTRWALVNGQISALPCFWCNLIESFLILSLYFG